MSIHVNSIGEYIALLDLCYNGIELSSDNHHGMIIAQA